MIKNYKELKIWQESVKLQRDFQKKKFELRSDRGEVERMLKALMRSLENKHLDP